MDELSADNQTFVNQVVTSGRFTTPQDAINEAVRLMRDEESRNGPLTTQLFTAHEWCDRFEKWAASHRDLPREADDSRDSIYAGRGE